MSTRTEVELVIRARTRIHHPVWTPCATSTPLRQPLVVLSSDEVTSTRKCNVMQFKRSCRAAEIEKSEEKRLLENVKKSVVKKEYSRTRRRLDIDYDDSDDEEKETQSKKHLIIKSGSSQIMKRGMNKKSFLAHTSFDSKTELKHDIEHNFLKSDKISDSAGEESNEEKCLVPQQVTCIKQTVQGKKAIKTKLKKKDSDSIVCIGESDNHIIKPQNIHKTVVTSDENNGMNCIVQLKRKNKSLKQPKRGQKSSNMSGSKRNNKKAKIDTLKTDAMTSKIKQKIVPMTSVSHEIFSDSKEEELRDSLKMTAADDSELSVNDLNGNQCMTKQKDLSKQNIESESLNQLNSCDNSHLSRPKRERKSPKEYWLPKNEKEYKPSCSDFNNHTDRRETNNEQNTCATIAAAASYNCEDADLLPTSGHVKDISKLEFVENNAAEGNKKNFLCAVGWEFSTFKCCALKILVRGEASGRTTTSKSHLGGVVLKGRLSMKIGKYEVKIKDGEMFHVPPLTDWKLVNIGRVECVLYYWVGKF